MLRWMKRLAFGAVALAVVGLIVGATLQVTASRAYLRDHPPPGRMVDLGTHWLHLYCEGSGSPTVVFDSGLGDGLLSWSPIQSDVAASTRACSYDRAGHGWSQGGPLPRTSGQIVEELRRLLEEAGIETPVVLVGHSFGGPNVRLFARTFPELVAGLVLVDGSHEKQREVLPSPPDWIEFSLKLIPWVGRVGLHRLTAERFMVRPYAITEEVHRHRVAQFALTRNLIATASEMEGLDTGMTAITSAPPLRSDLPLIALAAGEVAMPGLTPAEQAEVRNRWHGLQRDLVSRSSRGELRIIAGTGHYVHHDDPRAVLDAINEVVATTREEAAGAETP